MRPERKRQIRLVVALGAAVLLAAALVYTSFSAGAEVTEPSDLLQGNPSGTYDLTGRVVDGSIVERGSGLHFEVADRDDPSKRIPVLYSGQVPDPFRDGREVIVTGSVSENGTFVAEKDSLITKCPSKFTSAAENDPEHVIIED
jgi:cytochrome c-type biogenesis protein CcmE